VEDVALYNARIKMMKDECSKFLEKLPMYYLMSRINTVQECDATMEIKD